MRRTRLDRTGGRAVYRRGGTGGGGAGAALVFLIVVLVIAAALIVVGKSLPKLAGTTAATPGTTTSNRATAQTSASAHPAATPVGDDVKVVVHSGDTWSDVADQLQQVGLIPSAFVFRIELRLAGAGGDLEAGTYTIKRGTSAQEIMAVLEHATPPESVAVRFTEGWRTEQDADALTAKGVQGGDDLLSVAKSQTTQLSYPFLADKPQGASLEGYLFPDTYEILKDATGADIVSKMLDRFGQQVTPAMVQQAHAQGHSFYQTLIVASIVEREAAVPQERALIAGVYWNRLKRGDCMCADPTVQYALGKSGNWWPQLTAEARTLAPDSAYNTYTHLGFPPGPICNPGLASIQAALNPQGDYLYFVAKGDGTHIFSHTLAEQNQNVQKLQQSSATQ